MLSVYWVYVALYDVAAAADAETDDGGGGGAAGHPAATTPSFSLDLYNN